MDGYGYNMQCRPIKRPFFYLLCPSDDGWQWQLCSSPTEMYKKVDISGQGAAKRLKAKQLCTTSGNILLYTFCLRCIASLFLFLLLLPLVLASVVVATIRPPFSFSFLSLFTSYLAASPANEVVLFSTLVGSN